MKAILTTAILLAAFIPARLAAQCPAWESPDKSKKVKVTVWSDEGDCFKLKLDGAEINPDSASQVTFWMNVPVGIPKLVVQVHGQEDKKTLLLNETMAAVYYKLEKNKKGEYALKGQPFKAEKTAEAKAQDKAEFDAKAQKQKDDMAQQQAQRDKEWNDKRAAEQAERDKKAAEEKEKDKKEEEQRKAERDARWAEQRKQEDDARAKSNPARTEPAATSPSTSTTPATTTTTTPATTAPEPTSGKTTIRETFLYNGKPIANTTITMKTRDGVVIAVGKTDGSGRTVMYTDFPTGDVQVNFFGEKAGSSWSLKDAMRYNVGATATKTGVTDFYEVLKFIAEMMGSDAHSMGRMMGFE